MATPLIPQRTPAYSNCSLCIGFVITLLVTSVIWMECKLLSEQPLVQAHLADMVVDLDAARLLVLRAAYLKDTTGGKLTTEVSIGKLGATEAAQRVIDRAVQLFGGRGVMAGAVVEQLYRAIRPLRIYEGTSEIQRTIIGRALAKQGRPG